MALPRAQSSVPDEDGDSLIKSNDDSPDSGSNHSESEEEQTEWLATTREKRSTAGNRLSTLIQQAAAEDDDLELLFAEEEDDAGFEEVGDDASDVQMDSSDDDDDQGPIAGPDDLEGEKELQQQARAEKQSKKRKANDGIPKSFRKKVKIDPTAPNASPARPKKKSERMSWIPTADEAPTRSSARSTTKTSKEQLHAEMLNREKKRLRQLAVMEKAAKRKEALKPKELTQEDRLAEATRVEKQNAKSLNSWEEQEKIREEEQRAKLAALHDRKLQGPYITWWSGMAEWVGGKLKRVGKVVTVEEHKRGPYKKRKTDEMQDESPVSTRIAAATNVNLSNAPLPQNGESSTTATTSNAPTTANAPTSGPPPVSTSSTLPNDTINDIINDSQTTAQPAISTTLSQAEVISSPQVAMPPTPNTLDGSMPLPRFYSPRQEHAASTDPASVNPPPPRLVPSQTTPFTFTPVQDTPTVEPPPVTEHGTYNCLIMENFNENAIKLKDIQTQILFNKKFPKMPKPHPPTPCAITSYPAKFRDPSTNLPYCNAYAFKEIQKLKRGEYRWSTLLQAYVGQSQYAARGVPTRFIRNVNVAAPAPAPLGEGRPRVGSTGS